MKAGEGGRGRKRGRERERARGLSLRQWAWPPPSRANQTFFLDSKTSNFLLLNFFFKSCHHVLASLNNWIF